MRSIPVLAAAIFLSACASQGATPEKVAAAPAAKKEGPQCYSGDHGKFFAVDEKTTIAGVAVTCKPTGDNKAAQWAGSKH